MQAFSKAELLPKYVEEKGSYYSLKHWMIQEKR